jgi:hypothetical protein
MNYTSTCFKRRFGALIVAALLFCGLGATNAAAQMFQSTFGGGGGEAGRGGASAVLATGGFIAAGESFSVSVPNSDIYVVRVDNIGKLAWSNTYSIGNNDSATDIIECSNGDFVVCGVTDNIGTPCPATHDVFLMRLDQCGHVLWVETYGNTTNDEIGWAVIEATSGRAAFGTAPGDLIVAGSTVTDLTVGRDGYLLRVKATGALIWDRTYDLGFIDDYFYGLTEATLNNPTPTSTDDIVAVGGCRINGTLDGFLVRVDGDNGGFTAASHGSSIYSGPGDEELRSVCEIRNPSAPGPGDFVAAGYTTTGFGGVPEALLVETTPDICQFQSDRTLGDGGGTGPDEAYWVREDPLGNPGDVIATGYATLTGGLGGNDVFLHRFSTGPLAPVLPTGPWVYGGTGTDWGWSVSPVAANFPCASAGYVIAGFTNSFAGVNELYVLKTDVNQKTSCASREAFPTATYKTPNLSIICRTLNTGTIASQCSSAFVRTCQFWENNLCWGADGTSGICPTLSCPPPCIPPKLAPESGEEIASESMLTSYPNPVTKGSELKLGYTVEREGDVKVSVTDLMGRVLYEARRHYAAGSELAPVRTAGLASGTYIVSIAAGDRTVSGRVVVVDR